MIMLGDTNKINGDGVVGQTRIDGGCSLTERSKQLTVDTRGFGVAGEYPLETIHAAARAAENAGFRSFWLSQPPDRDSLRTLSELGHLTRTVELGIGAIPFTLRSVETIAESARQSHIPLVRLRLGIGSGIGPGALDRVRNGVRELKQHLDVHVVVAPLGPKMCRVAGEVGDSVLLNWLTPEFARTSVTWVQEGAASIGRDAPPVGTYVRCALGNAALLRLTQECQRYGSFPHYAAHFRRQSVEPSETTILTESKDELQSRLAEYEAVLDEVIVRAITPRDTIDETLALLDATRPHP